MKSYTCFSRDGPAAMVYGGNYPITPSYATLVRMASREIEGLSDKVEHVSLNVSKQNDLSSEESESTIDSRRKLR